MGYLLITNDDGIDSPALRPLIAALSRLRETKTVVPDRERSWIGKAITRWQKLRVRKLPNGDAEIYTVDAFPADCVQLAVHSLFEERPELVVSGVNLGLNYGSGFFFSSGTVGAAIEAWIADVPSVAFSMGSPGDDRSWKAEIGSDQFRGHCERAAALCAELVEQLLDEGYPDGCDLLSVNFQVGAGPETPREATRLADVCYTQLFRPEGNGVFAHDFRGEVLHRSALDGTDVRAVAEGRVSITPIRLRQNPVLADQLATRFTRL